MSTESTSRFRPVRRIVTKHDASGQAIVWLDESATNHKNSNPKVQSTLIWLTDETPAPFLVTDDAGARVVGTAPPAGGSRFTVIEFQPGATAHGLHRTDTIDYVICISGEIDMELDDSRVTMRAGDVMVQLGTNHAWINRGTEPARVAFVLLDGKPKRSGSLATGQNAR
jgi:quercetin dioxygenase-like cupin family protein